MSKNLLVTLDPIFARIEPCQPSGTARGRSVEGFSHVRPVGRKSLLGAKLARRRQTPRGLSSLSDAGAGFWPVHVPLQPLVPLVLCAVRLPVVAIRDAIAYLAGNGRGGLVESLVPPHESRLTPGAERIKLGPRWRLRVNRGRSLALSAAIFC